MIASPVIIDFDRCLAFLLLQGCCKAASSKSGSVGCRLLGLRRLVIGR